MNITVENTQIYSWEQGYPYWFHIQQDNSIVRFTQKEVYAVRDALNSLIKIYEDNLNKK